MQPKVKTTLHDIYLAEKREDAHKAFDDAVERFEAKYPKAVSCLRKDKEALLAFYDFPAEHWHHIRTTNPIESAFLSMVFKLLQSAEKRWRKIRGFRLLTLVADNVRFKDGELVSEQANRMAA